MSDIQLTVAFTKIAELAEALGIPPINQFGGCWYHDIDGHWSIAVNGHREQQEFRMDGSMGCDIPPFSAAVFWNGWLAGIIDPRGGALAAGELANEDTFIAALEEAIARGTNPRLHPA